MLKRILLASLFAALYAVIPFAGNILAPQAMAQYYGTTNKKAIKYYQSGIEAMNVGDKTTAIEKFKASLEADPAFTEVYLTIADIYMGDRMYDEALEYYQDFLEVDKKHAAWQDQARENIQLIEFRLRSMVHPVLFEPKNLGANINSENDEYLPALTVDGQTLIFTRRFPADMQTTHHNPLEEDFYISTLQDDEWSPAERMAEPVNTHDNEGAQCISQDGRVMFFTACGRRDGAGRCDIFMCTRKGNKWSKPRNLGPIVNSSFWESQPSFSIDGRTLYFVSDRPGGFGGMDIYKTVFANGKWSNPVNLGPNINTAGNEMSPFIHYDDHTLYFASDGHIGMGKLDIFVSRRDSSGNWGKPHNMGYPINTEGDESGLIVSADGHTGIYSSEATGGQGKMDLYSFIVPESCQATPVTYLKGTVYDKKTYENLHATIEIIDVATEQEVATTSSDATDGSFTVSLPANATYAFHVSSSGYLFFSQNYDLRDWRGNATPTINVPLSKIEVGEEIVLRNIFFNTAKYDLLPTSRAELATLVELMTKNPTIHVELGGHTDNVGKDDYNMTLSENRAKAVADYLVQHGIAADRITYHGYGATQPVAENTTEEGRAQNRRTTLQITSF